MSNATIFSSSRLNRMNKESYFYLNRCGVLCWSHLELNPTREQLEYIIRRNFYNIDSLLTILITEQKEENNAMKTTTYCSELDNELQNELETEFTELERVKKMRTNVLAQVETVKTNKGFKQLTFDLERKEKKNFSRTLKAFLELDEHVEPSYNYVATFPDLSNLINIPKALREDVIICYDETKRFYFQVGCRTAATAKYIFNKYKAV